MIPCGRQEIRQADIDSVLAVFILQMIGSVQLQFGMINKLNL
jgi:hypothetical protein